MANGQVNPVYLREWIHGRKSLSFRLANTALITKFIKVNKIAPVKRDFFHADDFAPADISGLEQSVVQKQVTSSKRVLPNKLWPRPFPGGLRIPHLHLKDDIYILNEVQWQKFTKTVIGNFQEKLAKTKDVNFEQLMNLSNAINVL